jgi:hypothetical protein
MLLGAILVLGFNFTFPKGILNSIAGLLSVIGAVAHVGMSVLDFVFWSFGEDYTARDELLGHFNQYTEHLGAIHDSRACLFIHWAFPTWLAIHSKPTYSLLVNPDRSWAILVGKSMGRCRWNNGFFNWPFLVSFNQRSKKIVTHFFHLISNH